MIGEPGTVVILKKCYLNKERPYFAYIYNDGMYKGHSRHHMGKAIYDLMIFYLDSNGYMVTETIDTFFKQEIIHCTIPYTDDSDKYNKILGSFNMEWAFKSRNNKTSIGVNTVRANIMNYFTEERLISCIREYNINQILCSEQL
jgi:hypothetical protein